MFQVATRLTGVVIAILDQILGLDCAKSSDVSEGLYLGVAKVVGAFSCGIEFSWLCVSRRRSLFLGPNLTLRRLGVQAGYSAPASRIGSVLPAGGFRWGGERLNPGFPREGHHDRSATLVQLLAMQMRRHWRAACIQFAVKVGELS
jgi:hypothetical protein